MKTVKTLISLCIAASLCYSCSSDDDEGGQTLSNQEFLTMGTWYQESKAPGSYSACEKKSAISFKTNGTATLAFHEDNNGSCEAQPIISGEYTLTGDALTITAAEQTLKATLKSVTEELLTLLDENGATLVFDKTSG